MWSRRPWGGVQSWSAGAARGSTFSPLNLTALRGWWKSDTGITIATGVSQWNDQSGNGNHLLQATGISQPTVTAGAINGLPAITFDGVNDRMAAAFALSQPITLFLVARQPTWTVNDDICDGAALADSMLIQQFGVSPELRIFAGASLAPNANWPVATFALLTATFNGASSSLQVNSTAALTGNAGTAIPGGLTLGARQNGVVPANVDIAEAFIMAAVPTAGEMTNVRAYILARYGFAA